MSDIGRNIRELRERANMSQDDLGTRIGKTRSAISQYESGKIVPRMGVIEDLARVFGIDKREIIGGKVTYHVVDLPEPRENPLVSELVDVCARLNDGQIAILLSTARNFAVANEKDGAGDSQDVARAEYAVI